MSLRKVKIIFRIITIVLFVLVVLSFIAGKYLFTKRVPLFNDPQPYNENTSKIGDFVLVEIERKEVIFKQVKVVKGVSMETPYYLCFLKSGKTFLASEDFLESQKKKAPELSDNQYYGLIGKYDETVKELLNNPEKIIMPDITSDVASESLPDTAEEWNDYLENNKNPINSNKEVYEQLFHHYQMSLFHELPTNPDPMRGTLVNIFFWIFIGWILFRILFRIMRPLLLKKQVLKAETTPLESEQENDVML